MLIINNNIFNIFYQSGIFDYQIAIYGYLMQIEDIEKMQKKA